MLNPQNTFCKLIGVEYCFWTMKVNLISLQEFKITTIPLVLSTKKRHLWLSVLHGKTTIGYYCFANKISKIEVNQPNILIFWPLSYFSIRWIKENYALMKFYFKPKCNEFRNRLYRGFFRNFWILLLIGKFSHLLLIKISYAEMHKKNH